MTTSAKHIVSNIKFQTIYPPEGDSAILEVSADEIGEFLHVTLSVDGTLIFDFFPIGEISLREDQIALISQTAASRLSLTDATIFEEENHNTTPS